MKIFIPTNELKTSFIEKGYCLRPLVIEAYQYHLRPSFSENTQKRLSKKVKTGTRTTNRGKAKEE